MRTRWSLLVVLVISASLLGLAPPASALVVCESEHQTFNALDGPSDHTFGCAVFFDAYLVLAHNGATIGGQVGVPVIGGIPVHFIACMVLPDGAEVRCEEACGYLLQQDVPSGIEVRVHITLTATPECVTLLGEVFTVFADE